MDGRTDTSKGAQAYVCTFRSVMIYVIYVKTVVNEKKIIIENNKFKKILCRTAMGERVGEGGYLPERSCCLGNDTRLYDSVR